VEVVELGRRDLDAERADLVAHRASPLVCFRTRRTNARSDSGKIRS
jgi:hypothetical protein